MIVIDTSLLVDYIFEKDEKRNAVAKEVINSLAGLKVFVPKIFLVEFISVAKRLGMKISINDVINLTSDFVLISEEEIFEEALKVAEIAHPRAIDSYFIATAKLTNSILITNDKVMAKS